MTRARARQLNNEVKSLLFESRFDISESWILPHVSYLCLISFTGEDGERDGDREMKRCLLPQDLRSDRHATTGQTCHRPNHTEKPCVVPQLKTGPRPNHTEKPCVVPQLKTGPRPNHTWKPCVARQLKPGQPVGPPSTTVRPKPAVRPVLQCRSARQKPGPRPTPTDNRSDRQPRRSDRHLSEMSREDFFWSLAGFRPSPAGGPTARLTGPTGTYPDCPERTFSGP